MATLSVLKLASVLLIVAICTVLSAIPHAAQECKEVENTLSPCIPHLKSSGSAQTAPPEACCTGVKSVKAIPKTTPERRAVCQCLKDIAANIPGFNYDRAANLPTQCGVTLSYTISPKTDCSKVEL